jgi:uncharacterized DUF497 family protein
MKITYNAAKNRRNIKERGVGFAQARELLKAPHALRADTRRDYGEQRFVAYGLIRGRLYVCVYTLPGDAYRIISLRKANQGEIDAYGPFVLR